MPSASSRSHMTILHIIWQIPSKEKSSISQLTKNLESMSMLESRLIILRLMSHPKCSKLFLKATKISWKEKAHRESLSQQVLIMFSFFSLTMVLQGWLLSLQNICMPIIFFKVSQKWVENTKSWSFILR